MWYILKQLFTSCVGESDGYLPTLRWIIVNYSIIQFYDSMASVSGGGHHRAQQTSQKENNNRIPFTLTFHPHNHVGKSIILKNILKLLQNYPDAGRIFSQPPLISFKCDKNIGNFLFKSAFQTSEQPGTFKCARAGWKKHVMSLRNCRDPIAGDPLRSLIILPVANVIYYITCILCKKLYIAETGIRLDDRFGEHLRDVEIDEKTGR